jgi:threonine/homoserine/homoserine lactone efflux protein
VAFNLLKIAGAVYLAYLGLRSLFPGSRNSAAAPAGSSGPVSREVTASAAFRQGLLGNLLNPKAGVIFVSILPQFVRPGDSPFRLGLMLLSFEVILLLWLNLYGYLVNRAGRSRAGERVRRGLQRVTGVVLIGLGIRLAVERR